MKRTKWIGGFCLIFILWTLSLGSVAVASEFSSEPVQEEFTGSDTETEFETETYDQTESNTETERITNFKEEQGSEKKDIPETEKAQGGNFSTKSTGIQLQYMTDTEEQIKIFSTLSECLQFVNDLSGYHEKSYHGESVAAGDSENYRDLKITFLSDYQLTNNEAAFGADEGSLGYRYRAQSLLLTSVPNVTVTIETSTVHLAQDTTFENIVLYWNSTNKATLGQRVIGNRLIANGNRLHMGKNVEIKYTGDSYTSNSGCSVKVIGGGDTAVPAKTSSIWMESGTYEYIFGGSWNANFTSGKSCVLVTGDAKVLEDICGGNYNSYNDGNGVKAFTGNSYITVSENATVGGNIYGGGAFSYYAMGEQGSNAPQYMEEFKGNSYIVIKDNAVIKKNVYGGSFFGTMAGDSYISFISGVIEGDLYGGNFKGYIRNCNIYQSGKVKGTMYGGTAEGSSYSTVYGDTSIIVDGEIQGNVFGGANIVSSVVGNTQIIIKENGIISGSVYAGGNSKDGKVAGNGSIFVLGGQIAGIVGGEDNTDSTPRVNGKKKIYFSGFGKEEDPKVLEGIINFDTLQIGSTPKTSYVWYNPTEKKAETVEVKEETASSNIRIKSAGIKYISSNYETSSKAKWSGDFTIANNSRIWFDKENGVVGSLTNGAGVNVLQFTKTENKYNVNLYHLTIDKSDFVTGLYKNEGDKPLNLKIIAFEKDKIVQSGAEDDEILIFKNGKNIALNNNFSWTGRGANKKGKLPFVMIKLNETLASRGIVGLSAQPLDMKISLAPGKNYQTVKESSSVLITQNSAVTVTAGLSYLSGTGVFDDKKYQKLQTGIEISKDGKAYNLPAECRIIVYDSGNKEFYYFKTEQGKNKSSFTLSDFTKMGKVDKEKTDAPDNYYKEESILAALASKETAEEGITGNTKELKFIFNFEGCDKSLSTGDYNVKVTVKDGTDTVVAQEAKFTVTENRTFQVNTSSVSADGENVTIPCTITVNGVKQNAVDTLYENKNLGQLGLYLQLKDKNGSLISLPQEATVSFYETSSAGGTSELVRQANGDIIVPIQYSSSTEQTISGRIEISGIKDIKAGELNVLTYLSAVKNGTLSRTGASTAQGTLLANSAVSVAWKGISNYDLLVETGDTSESANRLIDTSVGGNMKVKISYKAPEHGSIRVSLEKKTGNGTQNVQYEPCTQEENSLFYLDGTTIGEGIKILEDLKGDTVLKKEVTLSVDEGVPPGTYRLKFELLDSTGTNIEAEMPFNVIVY